MQRNSTAYTVGFAAAICVVCSILVSSSATLLKDRQIANALLDKQKKVLAVSGLTKKDEVLSPEEVRAFFETRIETKVVRLEEGAIAEEGVVDIVTYSQLKALNDPHMSRAVEKNRAQVKRIPLYAMVYRILTKEGELEALVLPVEGKGLWSTLYGFLALEKDGITIRGLTFYSHLETPGLGGEVDNPSWKAKWAGRKAFNEDGVPSIRVIKGPAGPPSEAPFEVDGLSGATITSNGVTYLLRFWLGDEGFGPYLKKFRANGSSA